jgi:hypothetical protein
MTTTINLQITFESLTEAIKSLDLTQKKTIIRNTRTTNFSSRRGFLSRRRGNPSRTSASSG